MHLLRWRAEMQLALKALSAIDIGYPQGENVLWPAAEPAGLEEFFATAGVDPRSPLGDLYGVCAGASLPDVHVGYFIHAPSLVLRGLARGEPRRVTGPYARNILVFGTDGGGGRFALDARGDGEILYLGEGAVQGGIFDGSAGEVKALAPDLFVFAERLLADVQAFVRGEWGWKFLV